MSGELTGKEAEDAIAADIEALGESQVSDNLIAGGGDGGASILDEELAKQAPKAKRELTEDEMAFALGISPTALRNVQAGVKADPVPEKRSVDADAPHALDAADGNSYVAVHTPPVRAVLVIPDDGNGRSKEIQLPLSDPANSLPDGTIIRKSHKPDAEGNFTYVGQLSVAFEPNPRAIGASFAEVAAKLSLQAYGEPATVES